MAKLPELLSEQLAESLKIANKAIGEISIEDHEGRLIVSAAQESILDSYCDIMEARKKELVQELQKIVMDYSAKIAATNYLLRQAGRMCGRQEIWRELYEEQRGEQT